MRVPGIGRGRCADHQAESGVIMARLMDEYTAIAGWEGPCYVQVAILAGRLGHPSSGLNETAAAGLAPGGLQRVSYGVTVGCAYRPLGAARHDSQDRLGMCPGP